MLGMIGVAPTTRTAVHVIGGGIDPAYLASFAGARRCGDPRSRAAFQCFVSPDRCCHGVGAWSKAAAILAGVATPTRRRYYTIGVSGVLLRGFEPLVAAQEYGRELIPSIRDKVAALDAAARPTLQAR